MIERPGRVTIALLLLVAVMLFAWQAAIIWRGTPWSGG
jgi:hypothetical protein